MSQHELTFEEVNKHFESTDLSPFKEGGKNHFTAKAVAAAPADVLQKICSIYKVVRPFLVLVSNLPLIPAKWKEAIKLFISLLDGVCPS
ncbi:MAG: hypothetical protein ABJC98_00550 [Bacteroidota bacterium]